MAVDLNSYDHTDEEYIDMEVSSNCNLFSHPANSPPHTREFEFQMFSSSSERETTTSPADELFYKGKLLPLHLPPRLQMVEKLLQNSNSYNHNSTDSFEEYFTTPLTTTTTYTTPTANTPFESCNISPSESFHVSQELNPNEYFSEFSTQESNFIHEVPKKSWTRKLKLIKQSLKSFFIKSSCSEEGTVPRAKEYQKIQNKNMKAERKTPFGQIHRENHQNSNTVSRSFNKEKIAPVSGGARHRRSFSGAIKRLSTTKCYSSSSSSSTSSSSSLGNSNGSHESRFLKRSSSVSSDMENSIQGAIAHCKRSQEEELHSRKTASEVPFYSMYSLSASRVVYEDQERPGLCRD